MKGYLLLCLIKRLWYRVASHPLEVTQLLWCGKAVPNTGGASCLPLNFKVVNVMSWHQHISLAVLGIELGTSGMLGQHSTNGATTPVSPSPSLSQMCVSSYLFPTWKTLADDTTVAMAAMCSLSDHSPIHPMGYLSVSSPAQGGKLPLSTATFQTHPFTTGYTPVYHPAKSG